MKKFLKIFNVVAIILSILIFEFGYCNHIFSENLLDGKITTFYFSVCRGIFYLFVFVAVLIINKKVDFSEVEATFNNKFKKILLIIYILFALCIIVKIAFNVIFAGEVIWLTRLTMLALILLGGLISIIYISHNYTINIISMFLLVSVFSLTCTTYNVLDEKKHFMTSYNISYGNIDFNNPVVDKQFMEEIKRGTHYTEMVNYFSVPYEYEQGKIPEDDVVDSTPATYSPILYIPSALGIFSARLLGGSVADVFYMGRIMNLIAYMGLVIIILKVLPYKKNIFFLIVATPMILCLAGTYSPDGLGVAFVTLFIAYFLKLYDKKENITIKELCILAVIYCFVLSFKTMSYFAIIFMVLLLPIRNIVKQHRWKILKIVAVALVALSILFLLQPKVDITQGDSRGGSTGAKDQIESLINNPSLIFEVTYNHITGTLINYNWLRSMNFEHYFSEIANQVFFCMIIYYFYESIKDDSKNFSKKEKALFVGIFFLIYAITSAVLYLTFTPIGSNTLTGYQSRYIFPIMVLILMSISNKGMKNLEKEEDTRMKLVFISNLLIIIALLGATFKW